MPQSRLLWKTRLFALIVILSNTFGNFCIARGMKHLAVPTNSAAGMLQAIFSPWVTVGITLLMVWLLSRMTLLSWADLSYVLPVTSLGYVANALMGHYFLGELITIARWGGTALIIAGTALVGLGARHDAPLASVPSTQAAREGRT